MRKSLLVTLSTLLLIFGGSVFQKAFATHAVGLELSYECQGGNQYEFTIKLYRDCAGITPPTAVTITLESASGSCPPITLSLPLLPEGAITEISPLCPAALSSSSCSGGGLQGMQEYVYSEIYTFLPTEICSDYVVSLDECCRNNAVTNLATPGSQSLYMADSLDNTICNSSPLFTNIPTPYICTGDLFCYNPGAYDPDGDSLVFTLVAPLAGPSPGTPIPYTGALSATYPIEDTRGFIDFDPATGELCVIPASPQVAVVAMRIDEYRGGLLVGSILRELQIVAQACLTNTYAPQGNPDPGFVGVTGAILIDSNSVEVCPGTPIHMEIEVIDSNFSDVIDYTSNITGVLPGVVVNQIGANPAIITIDWVPTIADSGINYFSFTFTDDGCDFSRSQTFSYDLNVISATDAGPDVAYCPAGGPVMLNAGGGSTFTWYEQCSPAPCTDLDPSAYMDDRFSRTPLVSPSTTVSLIVESDLPATCKNRDTIVVNVVNDFILDAGSPQTICKFGATFLDPFLDDTVGRGPLTYAWTPAGPISDPTDLTPAADPLVTTDYVLTVTTADGCSIADTVTITVSGVGPEVIAVPDAVYCSDPVELGFSISQPCQMTTQACTGPASTGVIGDTTLPIPASSSSATFHFGDDGSGDRSGRVQFLYKKTELDAMGLAGGGKISAISFKYSFNAVPPGSSPSNVQFKIGCTGLSSLGSGPPSVTVPEDRWPFVTGLTTITSLPSISPPSAAGQWVTFPIDDGVNDGYIWDGKTNLVIEWCTDDLIDLRPWFLQGETTDPDINALYAYNYATGGCSEPNGRKTTTRPVMQVDYCPSIPTGLTYAWSPGDYLSDSTIADPTSTPPVSTTYIISVDDGSCVGGDYVTVESGLIWDIDVDTSVCEGGGVFAGGGFQTTSGAYVDSYVPTFGCDSIVTTNLTILDTFETFTTGFICDGDSVFIGGAWRSTPGSYPELYTALNGCDSTVNTALSVGPEYTVPFTDTICEGDSIFIAGSFRYTSGIYDEPLLTIDGCDSVLSTTLTVIPPDTQFRSIGICSGDSFFVGGAFQSTPGIYYDAFTSSLGCDSTLSTSLSVASTITFTDSIDAFYGDTVTVNSVDYLDDTTVVNTYTAAGGCDSVVTTVIDFEVFVGTNPALTGGMEVQVYPNPTTGTFTVSVNGSTSDVELTVWDMRGKLIRSTSMDGDGKRSFDISQYASGIYYVDLRSGDARFTEKVILK